MPPSVEERAEQIIAAFRVDNDGRRIPTVTGAVLSHNIASIAAEIREAERLAEQRGQEAMREEASKVNPLSVACTFCKTRVGVPCWSLDKHEPMPANHATRWGAAIRALPSAPEPTDQ